MFSLQQTVFPIIQNDTLHCRPVVDIIEQTYLVKFNSGSRGRAPVGVWGRSPQKLNVFSFSEGDCCIKTGGRPPSVEDFRGATGGRPKRGAAAPPRPLSPWIRHW